MEKRHKRHFRVDTSSSKDLSKRKLILHPDYITYEAPSLIFRLSILCWKNFKLLFRRKRFLANFILWPLLTGLIVIFANWLISDSLGLSDKAVFYHANPIKYLRKCRDNFFDMDELHCVCNIEFGILGEPSQLENNKGNFSNLNWEPGPSWITDTINFIADKGGFDRDTDFTYVNNSLGKIRRFTDDGGYNFFGVPGSGSSTGRANKKIVIFFCVDFKLLVRGQTVLDCREARFGAGKNFSYWVFYENSTYYKNVMMPGNSDNVYHYWTKDYYNQIYNTPNSGAALAAKMTIDSSIANLVSKHNNPAGPPRPIEFRLTESRFP